MPETIVRAAFAIPGDIDLPTGGYAYDRRVLALLPELGIDIEHMPLPRTFPRPSGMDLCTTAQLLVAPPRDTVLLIDGLAYGINRSAKSNCFSLGRARLLPSRSASRIAGQDFLSSNLVSLLPILLFLFA